MTSENVNNKSIRVALIASDHTICEYSMFLQHMLAGLADESVPVALVCPPTFDSTFTSSTELIPHPVFKLPLMNSVNIKLLTERLAKFEPTVLHCLCHSHASLTKQLAHRLDIPYILMVNSLQKKWSRLPVSSEHCSRIIVPAQSIAFNVELNHPHMKDLIEQINMGTFVAENCGCFSDSTRLASIVMTIPSKKSDDFENVFNALKRLLIDGYEFMTVILGGGKADRHLWKLLDALGLLKIVSIVPRQVPWRSVLSANDIFIHTHPNNSFDSVLLQAMGAGNAVAGCKGGVDDLIIEDKTAVVFDPNDEINIASSLQLLLDKREFARQTASDAQQYLRENYSVSKMISTTLQIYNES